MDLDDLLSKTSRTFALAIPLLPEPTRRVVSVAYLLFRVADTFEDATAWASGKRIEALERLVEVVELDAVQRRVEAARLVEWCFESPPVEHAGYLELLRALPAVLEQLSTMPPQVRDLVVSHTVRTAEGMARVVARADARGNLRLKSLQDLKDYCYVVAGIVGELLTDIFLHDTAALGEHAAALRSRMLAFGEGLQLVNILKDARDDARDGRVYLPESVSRSDLFALARANLDQANQYVQALQAAAPRGYLAFTGLALVLAFRALDVLEARGSGAKVSREEVGRLFSALMLELEAGTALDLRAMARLGSPA